jgi:diadenylate cyclase
MEVLWTIRWKDILDILLVTFLFYWLFLFLKGTRAFQMLVGVVIFFLLFVLTKLFELYTIDWLVTSFWSQIVLALIILFQPEIRKALAQIGQTPFGRTLSPTEGSRFLEEIVKACVSLANKRIGAIIVLEREIELKDVVEMGTALDAVVSKEVLISIFLPYSPIHDGAVIIKGGRILAAGCFLPLTLSSDMSKVLGTRHRAALGVTEETDAVVIVVSEETGAISVIVGGKMTRELDAAALRRVLIRIFMKEKRRDGTPWMERFKELLPVRLKQG